MSRLQQRSYQAIRQLSAKPQKPVVRLQRLLTKPGWDMPSVLQPLAVKTYPGKIYLHECCSIQTALTVIQPLHKKSGSGSFGACAKTGLPGP